MKKILKNKPESIERINQFDHLKKSKLIDLKKLKPKHVEQKLTSEQIEVKQINQRKIVVI